MTIDLRTRLAGKAIRHMFLKHASRKPFSSAIHHMEEAGWSFKEIHMYPLLYQVILSPEGQQLDAPDSDKTTQNALKEQFYTDLKKALDKPKVKKTQKRSVEFRVPK